MRKSRRRRRCAPANGARSDRTSRAHSAAACSSAWPPRRARLSATALCTRSRKRASGQHARAARADRRRVHSKRAASARPRDAASYRQRSRLARRPRRRASRSYAPHAAESPPFTRLRRARATRIARSSTRARARWRTQTGRRRRRRRRHRRRRRRRFYCVARRRRGSARSADGASHLAQVPRTCAARTRARTRERL